MADDFVASNLNKKDKLKNKKYVLRRYIFILRIKIVPPYIMIQT